MIYLFGAGGHAKVILEILDAQSTPASGIWDDVKRGDFVGYPIIGKPQPGDISTEDRLIIAIGNNKLRKSIVNSYHGMNYIIATHLSSNISPTANIGNGTVIMAGTSINADTKIGMHCILNTNCSVDHDSTIGDFVHISPNAALAGNVTVGEGTHIGLGSCVIEGITIGKWATIGAGAVIINDVPDYAVVVGNPGHIVKYNSI